ncbi:MAG: thymidylate kinase [Candidatus Hodarchaeales archaeon]|jgi:dTMP kinase
MAKRTPQPLFIVIDGGDGSGKDTQAKLVKQYFHRKGYSSVRVRSHPAVDNYYGRQAKKALESAGKKGHLLAAVFYTFDVIHSLVKYYRHEDEVIIFSRYLLGVCYLPSVLVMFGYNFFSMILPTSEFFFYLEVNPEIARQRISSRGGLEEMFENLPRLRKMYRKMRYVTQLKNWHCINGDESPEPVWFQIKEILDVAFN